MHNPPPVRYAVQPSRLVPAALWLLWVAGVVVLGVWCLVVDQRSWRHWLPWGGLLLTAGFALHFARASRAGELGWNGLAWVWHDPHGEPQEGAVTVHLDWQRGMLIRFLPFVGPAQWVLVRQSMQPGSWSDLRRAAHAPQRQRSTPGPDVALPGSS